MTELSDRVNELLGEPSTSLYPNWGGNLGFVASTASRRPNTVFGSSIYNEQPVEWPGRGPTLSLEEILRTARQAVARTGIFLPQIPLPNARSGSLPEPTQRGSSTDANPRPYYGPDGEIVSVAEQEAASEPPVDFGQPRPTWGDLPKPVLAEPEIEQAENEEMATDWGAILSGAVDIFQGQTVGGGGGNFVPSGPGGFANTGGSMPSTVTVNTQTGKVTPCRRRRRRRLLTPTDLSDLAALATIVGKGDALKLATVKAVRR